MKIPDKLYNPNQEDQSLRGYINVYDNLTNTFFAGHKSGIDLPGISQDDFNKAIELCLKINIALRMLLILERHCDEQCELKIL